jgi:hypothetical protein
MDRQATAALGGHLDQIGTALSAGLRRDGADGETLGHTLTQAQVVPPALTAGLAGAADLEEAVDRLVTTALYGDCLAVTVLPGLCAGRPIPPDLWAGLRPLLTRWASFLAVSHPAFGPFQKWRPELLPDFLNTFCSPAAEWVGLPNAHLWGARLCAFAAGRGRSPALWEAFWGKVLSPLWQYAAAPFADSPAVAAAWADLRAYATGLPRRWQT